MQWRPGRWSRRGKLRLSVAAGVLVLLFIGVCFGVGKILGGKLVSLLEERLNAHVSFGSVVYRPPYTLSASDCRVTFLDAQGQPDDLLNIQSVRVTLAELPIHGGPLVVEEILVVQPAIHVIRTPVGIVGKTGLIKLETHANGPAAPDAPRHKLSEILRLRHLHISKGQVVYEDRTRPQARPMQWNGIEVHIDTARKGVADYDFNFNATNADLAEFQARGSLNVDDRRGAIEHFALNVHQNDERENGDLPPALVEVLKKHRVRGNLKLEGSGGFDPEDSSHNQFGGTLTLADASAFSPELDSALDELRLSAKLVLDANAGSVTLSNFSARSGGALLAVREGTTIALDRNSKTWSTENLQAIVTTSGAPSTQVSIAGGGLPQGASLQGALRQLNPGGSLVINGTLAGSMGQSPASRSARGSLVFDVRNLSFQPGKSADPVSNVNGRISVEGKFEADFSAHPAMVNCDVLVGGNFSTARFQETDLRQIKVDTELLSNHLQIREISAQALGGEISSSGRVETTAEHAYSGNLVARRVDLAQTARLLKATRTMKIEGLADFQMAFSGDHASDKKIALDSLTGEGQTEILQGNLWDMPALRQIEQITSVGREALTVGQAAAVFTVADRRIELQKAAVSAPALGLQSSGVVGFDGQLDLHVVAAPLADWRKKLKKTGIPIVSDVVGDVFGTVQDVLNDATSTLFYDIHVTGAVGNPQVHTEPTPILTEGAFHIFNNMLKQKGDARPADLLKADSKPVSAK